VDMNSQRRSYEGPTQGMDRREVATQQEHVVNKLDQLDIDWRSPSPRAWARGQGVSKFPSSRSRLDVYSRRTAWEATIC
jgi:hypothetical protein